MQQAGSCKAHTGSVLQGTASAHQHPRSDRRPWLKTSLLGQDADPPLCPCPALTKTGQREMQSDCPEMAFGSGGVQGNGDPGKLITSPQGHLFLLFASQVTLLKLQAPATIHCTQLL